MEPTVLVRSTKAFGNSTPNETVSGSTFKFNLRLPCQYFDNESNLNYNYQREYNSMLGRYIQSDPIDLNGGLNNYGYVGGNALWRGDVFGLWSKSGHDYFIDKMFTGMALHPVMDSTSPAHRGYQYWNSLSVPFHGGFSPWSKENVKDSNSEILQNTLRKMNDVFKGDYSSCGCQ